MITLRNITYLFNNLSIHFNLHIQTGERVAILGPSGAGKSSLLNLIAGFLIPDSGNILLNHKNHTLTHPSKRPISMLFQENNLFSHLTVHQNIALGSHPGLKLNKEQNKKLLHIVKEIGLIDYLHCLPEQLSGGQRQRTALARCMIRSQPILLLDEPFSALDPILYKGILKLINKLCTDRQLTLMLISHTLKEIIHIAERMLLIVDGKIYYDGPIKSIIEGRVTEEKVLDIIEHYH